MSARPRSILFTPGDSERKIEHALRSEADAVILDLEDSVRPAAREAARRGVTAALRAPRSGMSVFIRINAAGGADWHRDVTNLRACAPDGVVLPKATLEGVVATAPWCSPIYPLIETAAALRDAHRIAQHPAVQQLLIGSVDLHREFGLPPGGDEQTVASVRFALVRDSAAARKPGPIDGVYTNLVDSAGLRADAERAGRQGMTGKLCVHPNQLRAVNEVFSTTPEEQEQAARILAAYNSSETGALEVGGEMVDAATVEAARRTLGKRARWT